MSVCASLCVRLCVYAHVCVSFVYLGRARVFVSHVCGHARVFFGLMCKVYFRLISFTDGFASYWKGDPNDHTFCSLRDDEDDEDDYFFPPLPKRQIKLKFSNQVGTHVPYGS